MYFLHQVVPFFPFQKRTAPCLFLILSLFFSLSLTSPTLGGPAPKIPRFASLRSDKVNLRTGPGEQHPIDWTFTRRSLPVEVLAHYDLWRHVRTHEGITGWVHKRMLQEKQTAITLRPQLLRDRDQEDSPPVARVHPHVIGMVKKCVGPWCKVVIKGYTGWLKRADLWGVPQGDTPDS